MKSMVRPLLWAVFLYLAACSAVVSSPAWSSQTDAAVNGQAVVSDLGKTLEDSLKAEEKNVAAYKERLETAQPGKNISWRSRQRLSAPVVNLRKPALILRGSMSRRFRKPGLKSSLPWLKSRKCWTKCLRPARLWSWNVKTLSSKKSWCPSRLQSCPKSTQKKVKRARPRRLRKRPNSWLTC